MGYEGASREIVVGSKDVKADFQLAEKLNELGEVVVTGEAIDAAAQTVRESSFNVNVVEMKRFASLSTDMTQILNRVPGVRIRQNGGLGSDFNITLNGMSSLRIFIDGAPADGFGSSMSFNNFPVNMIERVDVYKGITPIFLGGDVLGGAINIITKREKVKFIDASYSYGTFNTHQLSLSGRFTFKNHVALNVTSFFNHSDNDYRMKVKSADSVTYVVRNLAVKRPHNAYTSGGINFETGVVKKPWADRLLVGAVLSANRNEVQGYTMTAPPLMNVLLKEISVSPTLKYEKTNLFTEGLDLRFSGIYNIVTTDYIDTVSRAYSWDGTYEELHPDEAEAGMKSLLTVKSRTVITTTTLGYKINDKHSFMLSHNWNRYSGESSDPYWKRPVPPADIVDKNIAGISYQLSLLNNRWVTNVFAKAYNIKSTVYVFDDSDELLTLENSDFYPGRGIATTYIAGDFQLKASYEYAAALPSARQIVGDRALLKANPYLKAEVSDNVNVSALYNKQWTGHSIMIEPGFFYRNPQDYIFLKSLGLNAQYQNVDAVAIKGVETSVRYSFRDRFFTELTATYQDMRHDKEYTISGDPDPLYGDRIPNTPYLFGNLNANYFTKQRGKMKWRGGINWNTSYVEEYFLTWESLGSRDSKNVIPRQFAHDIFLTFSTHAGKYNLTVGCMNIFDTELYDNFMVPKPGRSITTKLRININ